MSELIKNILEARVGDLQLPRTIQTCSPDALVHNVVTKMRESKIGCMVVVSDEKPVGLFTEHDYLMKIACLGINVRRAKIKNYMSANPAVVSTRDSVGTVLMKLRLGHFRQVVVIDGHGKLRDTLSIKDMLDLLLSAITQKYALAA